MHNKKQVQWIYIAIGAYNLYGVRKKITSKIQALNQELGSIECLYFCNDIEIEIIEDNIRFIPFKFESKIPRIWEKKILWRFQEFYVRKKKFEIIYKILKDYKINRGIIFRYIASDLNLFFFTIKYFKKIVFEFNTIDVNELQLLSNRTLRFYYVFSERLFGPIVRLNSKLLISVTHEIARYQRKKSLLFIKSLVISNGVDILQFPVVKICKYDHKSLNVLFTSGYPNSWHGVDILINSIKDTDDVFLHLVGEFEESIFDGLTDDVKARIIRYGKLSGREYDKVYEKINVAISSLALYRIGLKEGVVLKSREYAARCVPFILGYEDPDFKDSSVSSFILNVTVNSETPLDFNQIKQFVSNINFDSLINLNQYAQDKLGYASKAKEYHLILKNHF